MSARHHLLLPTAATLIALSACGSPAASAPAASAPAASAPAPDAAAPSATATAAAPASAAPTSAGPAAAVPAMASHPTAGGCPSASALSKLVELPKGAHFGSVQCSQGYAAADPQGPGIGDGVYLFKTKNGTAWRYYDQGSGWDCADLGLKSPAPFCIS